LDYDGWPIRYDVTIFSIVTSNLVGQNLTGKQPVERPFLLFGTSCHIILTVDGQWTSWSGWSQCDVTCGNGTLAKTRACSDPAPANGGSDCPGEAKLHKTCTRDLCPGM